MIDNELLLAEKKYKRIKVVKILTIVLTVFFSIVDSICMCVFALDNIRLLAILMLLLVIIISITIVVSYIHQKRYKTLIYTLDASVLKSLGLSNWLFADSIDAVVNLNSKKGVDNYDDIKFFKEHGDKLFEAAIIADQKESYTKLLTDFLEKGEYEKITCYPIVNGKMVRNLRNTLAYNILAKYTSPTGRSYSNKIIPVDSKRIKQLQSDKSLLMTKGEYSRYIKEQGKELLDKKHHGYYEKVNNIIDKANETKAHLIIKNDEEDLDKLVASLFDRTINSIKKIKSIDSEEWFVLDKFIDSISQEVNAIADKNKRINEYYNSPDFSKIKTACETLMSTQREFNEYIDEKVKSISDLFGTNVVRNDTNIEDEYNYIHPYKKSITPFTAEVSSTVFGSAENNPLDYVVKNFYPNKARYPEQIQKLQLLIEELETLREAKLIIENYKKDIQQYLTEVPDYIMENDESGFYSRLGFATIDEKNLTVEYKFSYTSNGGKAQRSFTVPMTEETIIKLIEMLESKLTMSAFSKEQRSLMTGKLRQYIKERDDYTCKICGNSTYAEPNLLLEIDHIIPVSKGGYTEEKNLQTLCWKCNRHKSSKLLTNENI